MDRNDLFRALIEERDRSVNLRNSGYQGASGGISIPGLLAMLATTGLGVPPEWLSRGPSPLDAAMMAGGIRIGGKFAAKTPGMRLERATPGDTVKDFAGYENTLGPSEKAMNRMNWEDRIDALQADYTSDPFIKWYNLVEEATGNVRGSIKWSPMGKRNKDTYIGEIWVDKPLRKSHVPFLDLVRPAIRGGGDIDAHVVNEKLEKVFNKLRARRMAEREQPLVKKASERYGGRSSIDQRRRAGLPNRLRSGR